MKIGDIVLVLIILGVIVQLVGSYRRAQQERAAAAAGAPDPAAAEHGAETGDYDQLPDDEVPDGYVIDERRDDGSIVLRPVSAVERRDRDHVSH